MSCEKRGDWGVKKRRGRWGGGERE